MNDSVNEKVAVIIGVGAEKGMGAALCRRFAACGYFVVVAGRTFEKLECVVDGITAHGGKACHVICDATQEDSLESLFAQASSKGQISLAIYNAGSNMPGDFLSMEPSYFEKCWRTSCFGGFLFSQLALRHMAPNEEGTLLFTGASASMRGKPFFSAFTAAKAGLRALAQSLAREFGPKGIHVAHVVIDGAIDGDRINKGRPEVAEALGKDGLVDIEGIVDIYHMLEQQPRRAWTHEIDVRTAIESF